VKRFPVINTFYSRKEGYILYIVCLLIILVFSASLWMEERMKNLPPVDLETREEAIRIAGMMEEEQAQARVKKMGAGEGTARSARKDIPFFDPNTASREVLMQTGISPQAVNSVIAYREAGGVFRTSSDLKRMYGLTLDEYEGLLPKIRIDSSFRLTRSDRAGEEIEKLEEIKNINLAEFRDIVGIEGVDGKLASRILKYRDLLGGFHSPDQLKEVYDLPDNLIGVMDSLFIYDTTDIRRISLSTAGYKEFLRHPYLGNEQVDAIMELRKFSMGKPEIKDFINSGILETGTIQRILPYIKN
jgi:DNA uptake protein ComE-like DNA-binding protein